MIGHSKQNNKRLLQMLRRALDQEKEHWQAFSYTAEVNKGVEIRAGQRDNAVGWLSKLNTQFEFTPDTFSLSVLLLDRFLHKVKARPKYLHCIAIACFYIAAKTLEEDEMLPDTSALVRESYCGCTVSEVLRMERCVLDKLSWDIKNVTALNFLQIFHALLLSNYPSLLEQFVHVSPSKHLGLLTEKLKRCLTYHPLLAFRASTLALSLISLELEVFMPDWLSVTYFMQNIIETENMVVIRCREIIARHMSSLGHSLVACKKYYLSGSFKRKVEVDEDSMYDGIKRLYSEETGEPVGAVSPCGQALRQGNNVPPLRALVN